MRQAALHLPEAIDPRRRSLARGNILVWTSVIAAILLSHFPHNRPTLLIVFPAAAALFGTFDTLRCIRRRWSFYHAGVIFCLYMDLMAVFIILFLLIYPFAGFITSSV